MHADGSGATRTGASASTTGLSADRTSIRRHNQVSPWICGGQDSQTVAGAIYALTMLLSALGLLHVPRVPPKLTRRTEAADAGADHESPNEESDDTQEGHPGYLKKD